MAQAGTSEGDGPVAADSDSGEQSPSGEGAEETPPGGDVPAGAGEGAEGAPDSPPASTAEAGMDEPGEPAPLPADGLAPVDDVAVEDDLGAIEEIDLEALLSEPVVTASGGAAEERVLAAANVIVINREEIQRHGWRSLHEVLESVPGIYVVNDHVIPSLGVRGVTGGLRAGSRLVKVMINGVPVNFRPDLTAFLGPEFIPMDAVARVEIVQGPLSALYGANAFIATVNVITREPAGPLTTEVSGRASIVETNGGGGGSIFTAQGGADLGLTASFSYDWIDRSGLRIQRTFPSQDPRRDRYQHFFREPSANDVASPMSLYLRFHAGQPTDEVGRFTLQGGIQRLDAMGEFQVNSAMSHQSRYSIVNYWSSARLDHEWSDKVSGSAHVGFSAGEPTRDYQLYVTQDDNAFYEPRFGYKAVSGGLELIYSPLGERLSIRLGADAELDFQDVLFYRETFLIPFGELDPGDSLDLIGEKDDHSQLLWDTGIGLQLKSVPLPDSLPGLRLTGNVRTDFIRYGDIDFPPEVSWRAGIVYQWVDGLVTKVIGGRAFQTPSGVLMFAKPGYGRANNVVGNADVTRLGFPELRPQAVTGAEAIVSAKLFGGVTLDVSGYFQEIEDRIQFEQLATDFIAVNSQNRQFVGGLANLKLKIDRVSGYATTTIQRQIVDGQISSDPPEQFPNYFGTFGLNVDVPEAHLLFNAHLRWATERGATQSNRLLNNGFYKLGGYSTLDLTLSTIDLRLWDDESETRLMASVRNVWDERYSEPGFAGFDIPSLGRSFWFEVQQTF